MEFHVGRSATLHPLSLRPMHFSTVCKEANGIVAIYLF